MEEACPGRRNSWPELVGATGEAAAAIVARQNPKLHVYVVKEGMMVTTDFRCDRVRIWVNKGGIVTLVPHLG